MIQQVTPAVDVQPGWTKTRLGRVVRLQGGVGFPVEHQGQTDGPIAFYKVNSLARADASGVICETWDTISPSVARRLGATVLPPGTIVIAKIGAALLLGRVRRTSVPAAIDNNMLALVPSPLLEPRFLSYFLQTVPFDLLANPGAVPSLDMRALRDVELCVPSMGLQTAVADYLDRETSRIDRFNAKSRELVELLTERERSFCSRALMGGTNDSERRTRPGPSWMGAVPASWDVRPIKSLFHLTLGKMLNESTATGDMVPYLRAGNIQNAGLDLREVKYMRADAGEIKSLSLKRDDVVFVEGGAGYGRSDVVRDELDGWIFQNHVIRLRARKGQEMLPAYLHYWLRHIRQLGHYEALGTFATIPNISAEKLGRIAIPKPSLDEQRSIVALIEANAATVSSSMGTATRATVLATERRAALISAAVTGRIGAGVAA
jgi:type I restriction enzyme S subunit